MTKPTDIISILAEWFPKTFWIYEGRRRPLKVGIHHDVLARTAGAIAPKELGRALRRYTSNGGYLRAAAQPGAVRVDLDGMPSGTVTPEQAEDARLRLSLRKQRIAGSPPPAAKAAASPRIDPPTVKRLSLADLRAAAQQRRHATQATTQEKSL